MKKENTTNQDLSQLHDIWALHTLQGEEYSADMSAKHPTLELFLADKRVAGNDGCNRLMGSISTISETELVFGSIGGTKMMCQNMKITDGFNQALRKVVLYERDGLFLILKDTDNNELMMLKKVD